MKYLPVTFLFFFIPFLIVAQKVKDIPDWGIIDKSILEMKACPFDKDAEAMVLFDAGELVADIGGQIEFTRHIRIKILKEKGFEKANIHIPYHSYKNDESIRKLTAQTFNLDAAGGIIITPIDKKSIMEKKIDSRYTEMVFAFPEVKVGSVIEYRYTVTNAGVRNWNFQRSIPVAYSRYKTDFPYQIELMATPHCVLNYTSTTVPNKSDRIIKMYTMSNVPALRDEPFISTDDDYLQRLEMRVLAITTPDAVRHSMLRTWPGIIKELMEDPDFGDQLKKNIPRTADLDATLKTLTSPYEKMKTIHHYVQKNMEWNGYSNIWALDGVKSAWKDKKGTSGEINLILVNLLKDAGLDAKPVLVSTRSNGYINTLMAGFQQFNKVMAYVTIGENFYVLDATNKDYPSHLIPDEVMYSQGLVIEKLETFEWGWKTLWNENLKNKNFIALQGTIDENGLLKGEASITSIDYAKLEKLPVLKKGKDTYIKESYTDRNPDTEIVEFKIENEETDSLPLKETFKFNRTINGSGDYKYFTVNMFTGMEKNPFIAESRFSDVFFGENQSYNIIGNISIPEGYVFEELPKNIRMMMPDSSINIKRIAAVTNNNLSVRISLDFSKPIYTIEEYPDFREFYKKLFELLNEPFVIRKKALPIPKP